MMEPIKQGWVMLLVDSTYVNILELNTHAGLENDVISSQIKMW